MVDIIDFAADDTVPEFYVGPENHFICNPDIPLSIAQKIKDFRTLQKSVEETGDISALVSIFDELLTPPSAELFKKLISAKVIGVKRIGKIIPWILEEYGLGHPTQPSSPSSDGLNGGETGHTSVDGAFPTALALGGSSSPNS